MTRTVVSQGFTLIELMIGIAIFAFLTVLAVPMYGDFIANAQVRTAAESVLTGLRLAQAEAVHRSVPVRFEMIGNTGWQVIFHADDLIMSNCGATTACTSDNHLPSGETCAAGTECLIRSYSFTTGAPYAYAATTGGTVATFSSLGVLMPTNNDGTNELQKVTVSSTNYASARQLWVMVGGLSGSTSGAKICDPSFPLSDPMGCPAS